MEMCKLYNRIKRLFALKRATRISACNEGELLLIIYEHNKKLDTHIVVRKKLRAEEQVRQFREITQETMDEIYKWVETLD